MTQLNKGVFIDGKYEILEPLKGGGLGEVYLVRHQLLRDLRVVKLLRGKLAQDPEAARRFEREARTATQIKHPQVATLHDYSLLPDDTYYMVWEYIEGEDLGSWLGKHGPMPLRACLHLAIQTLQGLEAIHSARVIHRDISPDNLMITRDPRGKPTIKIIDLGLARSLTEEEGQPGMVGGKFLYCSPEQAHVLPQARLDHRSDLYSFALVVYEMACGLRPFDDRQPGGLQARFEGEPLPLAGRNPQVEVPPELDAAMRRALSRSPDDRFQDAQSLAEALARVLGDRQRAASQPTPADDAASLVGRAEQALGEGRVSVARGLVSQIEALGGAPLGLTELQERLRENEDRRRSMQVLQTEELLEQYIVARQGPLAAVALELLLELDPAHSRRDELELRVEAIAHAVERHEDVDAAVMVARRCVQAGDLDGARDQLGVLEELGAGARTIERLRSEIEENEEERRRGHGASQVREKLEQLLDAGRAEAARQELEQLQRLGVPKAVVDVYRGRLAELRDQSRSRWRARMIELKLPRLLSQGQWDEARELALELGRIEPGSPRASAAFTEVIRQEELFRRQQAIEEGKRVVESLLRGQRLQEAEVALETLLQLAPNHPDRDRFLGELHRLRTYSTAGPFGGRV